MSINYLVCNKGWKRMERYILIWKLHLQVMVLFHTVSNKIFCLLKIIIQAFVHYILTQHLIPNFFGLMWLKIVNSRKNYHSYRIKFSLHTLGRDFINIMYQFDMLFPTNPQDYRIVRGTICYQIYQLVHCRICLFIEHAFPMQFFLHILLEKVILIVVEKITDSIFWRKCIYYLTYIWSHTCV